MPDPIPLLGKKKAKFLRGLPALGKYTLHMASSPMKADWGVCLTNIGQMGNDTLGDCTCAAIGHMIQAWTAMTDADEVILPDATIIDLYAKSCGYVIGDPYTDNGGIAADVLRYWYQNPVAGKHSLSGFAAIRPGNRATTRDAIYLFGAAYIGVQLPLSAQTGEWDRKPDGPLTGNDAPGSWGGHAIPVIAYDEETLTCITWGKLKKMSWNWLDAYCDEGFGCLSKDWINSSGRAPPGFDFATLENDMMAIRGSA